eukprot:987417-Heterocapsa_arctica.AAC.1
MLIFVETLTSQTGSPWSSPTSSLRGATRCPTAACRSARQQRARARSAWTRDRQRPRNHRHPGALAAFCLR